MEITTHSLAIILFLGGALGLVGMTLLFPLFALCAAPIVSRVWPQRHSPGFSKPMQAGSTSLSVLICAHDEEDTILATLRSVRRAAGECLRWNPELEIRILVGLDGCRDSTKQIVQSQGVRVLEAVSRRGKWRTMQDLVKAEGASDLVAFVDSGVLWSTGLLCEALREFRNPMVMAVAPSYRKAARSGMARMEWAIEGAFKQLESYAGGPVSVHGASMFFRTPELLAAWQFLGEKAWSNDDVVLPLSLRMLFPEKRIVYLRTTSVLDKSESNVRVRREFPRRARLVQGNLEWIKILLPSAFRQNPVAAILSLRRFCRVFWGYWFTLCVLGLLLLAFDQFGTCVFLLAGTGVAMYIAYAMFAPRQHSRVRFGYLLDCLSASLAAPVLWFRTYSSEATAWK